jgi:hypothetical protein
VGVKLGLALREEGKVGEYEDTVPRRTFGFRRK